MRVKTFAHILAASLVRCPVILEAPSVAKATWLRSIQCIFSNGFVTTSYIDSDVPYVLCKVSLKSSQGQAGTPQINPFFNQPKHHSSKSVETNCSFTYPYKIVVKYIRNRVIRKVSLCFDRFWVHYSHKPMETQSKALEFQGIIHKARVY